MNNYKKTSIIMSIAIITMTILAMSITFMNNDGTFILATGRYIIENGIPFEHPFSIIKDLNFVAQQWLWAVICWLIYDVLGNIGIYIISIITYLLNILVLNKIAKIKKTNTNVYMVLISLIFLLNFNFISIRPTMVTNLLLLLQVYVIEKYMITNKKVKLLWLIPIMILEINLHASLWWMHFVFLLPYIVPPIKNPIIKFTTMTKEEFKSRITPIIFIIIPMILTGILNPYGMDGVMYLIKSYNSELNSLGIIELEAPATNNLLTVIILAIIFICLHIVIKSKNVNQISLYFFCGTTILGLMHLRNSIYFYFGFSIILIDLLKDADFSKLKKIIDKWSKVINTVSIVLVACICIVFLPNINKSVNKKDVDSFGTPVKAIEYLNSLDKKDIKIYTEFNNGGYFELKGYNIFVDARPELYFKGFNEKQDIMKDYVMLRNGCNNKKDYLKLLNKYNFDYLCVDKDSKLNILLESLNDYKPIINSEEYVFYKNLRVK